MKKRTENIENDLLMEKEKKTNRVMANIISFVKIHKKMTIAIALFLCVAITGSIFLVNRLSSNTGKPQMVANFSQTIELTKRDISNSISVTGTLASANAKSISVDLSNVEVEEIYVEVGDVISEGDIICRFNSDDIQNSLKDAKTNLSITNTKTNMEIQSATDNLENAQIKRNIEAERASTEVANAYSEYEDKVSAESNAKSAMDSANSAANAKLSQYNSLKSELTSLEGSKTSIESEFGNIITELVSLGEANFSGISITNDISGISYDSNNQEVVEKVGKLNTLQTDYQSTITSITTKNTQLTSANEEYQNLKAQAATKTTVYEQAQTATKSASSSYQKAVQNQDDTNRNNDTTVKNQQNSLTTTQLNATTSGTSEEEQVEKLQTQLENCTVVSPISGVITSISIVVGDKYSGTVICEIQDNTSFVVNATVDQYDVSDIAKGMKSVIKTDTTEELEMNGELTFVSPIPESGSSMGSSSTNYAIKISVIDPSDRLRIGMTAKTSIVLESLEDTFAVPYDCIQTNQNGESIIKVKERGESEEREIVVEKLLETDYYVGIQSDELEEGMQIVMPQTVVSTDNSSETQMNGMFSIGGMGGATMSTDMAMPSQGSAQGRPDSSGGNRPSGGASTGGF